MMIVFAVKLDRPPHEHLTTRTIMEFAPDLPEKERHEARLTSQGSVFFS